MHFVGIDIGSTASKAVVLDEDKHTVLHKKVMPSGWNSKETGELLLQWIYSLGFARDQLKIIATGYGRVSVPYADSTVTEITCHGRGAAFLADGNVTVIDIGGQDIKVIVLQNGKVLDFVKAMDYFNMVVADIHGIRPAELVAFQKTGGKVVGSFCIHVPDEVVIAGGAIATGLCSGSQFWVPGGEKVLPTATCALIKASYGHAITDTCPFFYFSDFIIGETTCDGKKKMFELLNDIKPTYVESQSRAV